MSEPVKPVRVWAIVDDTGEIRIGQLRKTEAAAKETASGWQYRGRKHRIVEVEIRPNPPSEGDGQ